MAVTADFEGADFGDRRLTKRCIALVEALIADPAASFPEASRSEAELEATYRFLRNDDITPQRILAPHAEATARRAQQASGWVVVAHDTTEFSFSGDREGLGLTQNGRGFFAHFALAQEVDPIRKPLGVLGLRTFVRPVTKRSARKQRHSERLPPEQRESIRWRQLVEDVECVLSGRVRPVHVMDSEADSFELFEPLVQQRRRFVIRLTANRATTERGVRLHQRLQGLEVRFTREVPLSKRVRARPLRAPHNRNADRSHRLATLSVSATAVTLLAPVGVYRDCKPVDVHVVHVREVDAPPHIEPVDWKLLTTEPIESIQDIERIIDAYRARWTIEEFFKALKTGCAFEKRQLTTLPALLNALAVFTPIATELLRLRSLSHEAPNKPASTVLRPLQILLLQRHKDTRLDPNPSVLQALLAIARLGGHITNNGPPGWLVLGRGYEKLLAYEAGALLARDL
jgi:hypothetical protein